MKKLLSLLILVPGLAFGSGFMSAFEDVPLMEGLYTKPPVIFDTDMMRFVEQFVAEIEGVRVGRAEFERFYREAMPALGWRVPRASRRNPIPDGTMVFQREGEALTIEILDEEPFVARFWVVPVRN